MNKAILVGRLTKDPELKMTENTKREVCLQQTIHLLTLETKYKLMMMIYHFRRNENEKLL